MEKLISEQIVDSILSQDTDAFVGAFNAAIAAKVTDALEVKKVEIASSLITPEMAVEEEVEQVDEAFRLFHPGKKATIKSIDKHGFTGRDDHPPTDGSLDGHTIRITDYGDATGKHGVTSGYGGPRYQAVRGKVLTGKHKGKEFEFIQHELKHAEDVKEEAEQIDEISTGLIARARGIANQKAADADYRGHDVEREIHASQAGRFNKALKQRERAAQLSRVSAAKARKYILSKEEAVNNKMATINEDLGSAYEEIMASHHSARQKGRDALAAGNHAAAENHFVSAGLHLSKAEEVAKDYFKFHGVELHKPNHPRYSPYITGNWDKVT